mgnify:CR=1 FL=1
MTCVARICASDILTVESAPRAMIIPPWVVGNWRNRRMVNISVTYRVSNTLRNAPGWGEHVVILNWRVGQKYTTMVRSVHGTSQYIVSDLGREPGG